MSSQSYRNVRAEMILAGVTQKAIAAMLEINIVSVNDVVHFRRATPRIREAIAQAVAFKTGRTLKEVYNNIWPNPNPQEEVAA